MESRRSRFSGHQTFAFRYGWLEKGCQYVREGKQFAAPDALVHLGVGKNMVESIKYWCEILGLTDGEKLTSLAETLLNPQHGWDPYLEDDASLWLLHWKLCTQKRFITAATLLFGEMHKVEFTRQDWLDLMRQRDSLTPGKRVSEQTLERDVECCIKTYIASRNTERKRILELSFACPFQELGLLSNAETEPTLHFLIGPKVGLPAEVIGYAIWEFISFHDRSALPLKEIMNADYSPGQIFMLDENSMVEAIRQLSEHPKFCDAISLTLSEGEGLETVHCALEDGDALLRSYYKISE